MNHDPTTPTPTDFDQPSPARMHDWLLGGTLNTAIDRAATRTEVARLPGLRELTRHNRAFLHRAVHFMIETGIRQFLDLGSGLPTMTPTHALAHRYDAAIPVVYVDHDAITRTHARLILDGTTTATIIDADLRQPHRVLRHPQTRRSLDLARPVGIIAVDILDTLPDHDRPGHLPHDYLDAVLPGSTLALTHITTDRDSRPPHGTTGPARRYPRPPDFLHDAPTRHSLSDPGVVPSWEWRPDTPPCTPPATTALAAVFQAR